MIFISLSGIFSAVWPYLVAILLFVIVIIIHEFGHFIVAKLCKIKVNEFSVGFDPQLFKKKIKDTEYSLRLIPFGGFCAMEGEDEDSTDPNAFNNKKAWQRFLVVAAGAVFNIVLGFVIAFIIVVPKQQYASTTVSKFDENAVSCNYGLKTGDEIVKVNGRSIVSSYDLSYVLSTDEDGTVDMVVKRNKEKIALDNVKFKTTTFDEGTRNERNVISLDFYVVPIEKTFSSVISQTFKTTVSYCKIVYMSLADLISGQFGLSEISGPVGIVQAVSDAAKQSLSSLLIISLLITVNLGIMNLLPLPALDGGRLVFILIEMIFRKPVPKKYEGWVHAAGLIILLIFISVVTFSDILKLFN